MVYDSGPGTCGGHPGCIAAIERQGHFQKVYSNNCAKLGQGLALHAAKRAIAMISRWEAVYLKLIRARYLLHLMYYLN